jgi:hypothetical protein
MLSVVMLNVLVLMLSVVMLNVLVLMLSVVMLNLLVLGVMKPYSHCESKNEMIRDKENFT